MCSTRSVSPGWNLMNEIYSSEENVALPGLCSFSSPCTAGWLVAVSKPFCGRHSLAGRHCSYISVVLFFMANESTDKYVTFVVRQLCLRAAWFFFATAAITR